MDNRANDARTSYDLHIPKQEEWQEEPWFCGIHKGREASAAHHFDSTHEPPSAKITIVDAFDMEPFNNSRNESMHPADSFKPISIQNLSRPPMLRSYGSSSASSASTLMTPRDAHSWAGSAHSPSYIDTIELIPGTSQYQLHGLPSVKLVKDISFGDFPTGRDFRFPSHATSTSPESPEIDWFLEDQTETVALPLCSYRRTIESKRSKKTRTLGCIPRDTKQAHKSHRGTVLPGLGIISLDGSYKDGISMLSKSKSRHGPLTPEQRQNAALMRRHGACRDCRKRKIKVRFSVLYWKRYPCFGSSSCFHHKILSNRVAYLF
jgi:hypothetical protein